MEEREIIYSGNSEVKVELYAYMVCLPLTMLEVSRGDIQELY